MKGLEVRGLRPLIGATPLALALIAVSPAIAWSAAYPPNTGAVGIYGAVGSTFDGLAGYQMLTPLTPHSGYFIAHPGQVNPSFSSFGDFIGLGSAKGVGVDLCSDYYGSGWQVYADGSVYGVYFCNELQYVAGNAQSQSFIIQRHPGSCPHETGPGWDVLWQRVVLECISESFSWADLYRREPRMAGTTLTNP